MGDHLDRAQKAQHDAVRKLAQGPGNLVRQAEMLRQLGVAPSKKLPAALQDTSAPDEDGADDGSDAPDTPAA